MHDSVYRRAWRFMIIAAISMWAVAGLLMLDWFSIPVRIAIGLLAAVVLNFVIFTRFRCPRCGTPAFRHRGIGFALSVYAPWPRKRCCNCGFDLTQDG